MRLKWNSTQYKSYSYNLAVDTEMSVHVVPPAPVFPKPWDKRRENPQLPGFYHPPHPQRDRFSNSMGGGAWGGSCLDGYMLVVKPFQTS